MKSDQ